MSTHRMPARDALAALHAARGARDVVITTMAPARDWMTLPPHPLDIVFVPSAMGHATSLGLGIALAQPERRVIVCNGDGSMLMNLGSLASITGAGAANLILLVFENGIYEVTGGQQTAGSRVDFAGMARAAGFASVFEFSEIGDWTFRLGSVLGAPGPVFALLRVEPVLGVPGPRSPGPAAERARRIMEALRS